MGYLYRVHQQANETKEKNGLISMLLTEHVDL